MPVLQAINLHYQFENGETLFRNLSVSMTQKRVGLVGRNGVGKSILALLLTKQLEPTGGSVQLNTSVAMYQQINQEHILQQTVADFLDVKDTLYAIEQIEQGDCDPKWFECVGDRWDLRAELSCLLQQLQLPDSINLECKQLSGGQLSRLQLWKLFNSGAGLLVLDEPSNHLDSDGKQWLIEQIQSFSGHILLISHDRLLLREVEQIWELSSLGLTQYGGNFDFYTEEKRKESDAVARQLSSVKQQQKHLDKQAQKNKERAEQRAAAGKKLRKEGSQAKILMDAMSNRASASASGRAKNEAHRQQQLQQKSRQLESRQEQLKAQKLKLSSEAKGNQTLVSLINAELPYGSMKPINLTITGNSKLHLVGANGSGKSTLLKVLRGDLELKAGEVRINTAVFYLDQHFNVLQAHSSVLDNILNLCRGMSETKARTLLAGIGLRKDKVYQLVNRLSGGEKMKLAMLIASNQPQQPLLLLDEPDNHLDIDSKDMLSDALLNYDGALILVSHDESFVKRCGLTTLTILHTHSR